MAFGSMIDPLTAIMVAIVSTVSLLVQIYSLGYMKGSSAGGYTRYFIYMSLFTASMLGLVISRNLIQVFVFWELVGVSSYFLIGFWVRRPAAAVAAKKAFLMTRLGDFGFLLALMYLFTISPSLDIPELYALIHEGGIGSTAATLLSLGFLAAAVGKSAQFPLHGWLPDAMEGPTSVSALIHSATMVAAGVFLIARLFPLFEASEIMPLIAIIGAITAIIAASMALATNDIKRVLAFSTISQLGYMIFALGIGAYAAAIFHLFTHAFFKAGLFLAAGSVHHASGTFNMKYMGGLRRYMPVTYLGIVICGLSLVGIFPLSGFWSKGEILSATAEGGDTLSLIILAVGIITAALTAFYMFRAVFITFHGKYRGGAEEEAKAALSEGNPVADGLGHTHLAESPRTMVVPLVLLSVLAITVGFLINAPSWTPFPNSHVLAKNLTKGNISGNGFSEPMENRRILPFVTVTDYSTSTIFLEPSGESKDFFPGVFTDTEDAIEAGGDPKFNVLFEMIALVLSFGGIGLAALLYRNGNFEIVSRLPLLKPAANFLFRRYYLDDLYERTFVGYLFYGLLVNSVAWADSAWLDNLNIQIAKMTNRIGWLVSQTQTGQLQAYAALMASGAMIMILVYIIFGR